MIGAEPEASRKDEHIQLIRHVDRSFMSAQAALAFGNPELAGWFIHPVPPSRHKPTSIGTNARRTRSSLKDGTSMKAKQIAALPFRTKSAKLRILLITTRGKRRWSVPKGWPMRRKQPHRAAAVEAYEEAGLLGRVSAKAIGRFKHSKRKGKRKLVLDVKLFPMKVKKRRKD